MADNLTPKQEAFCLAYLETGNASEAFKSAYNAGNMTANSIYVSASRMLKHPKISLRLDELRAGPIEKAELSKTWVLERLIVNANRAMEQEPVMVNGKPSGEYTYQGSVANRALELLGKELGMFVDRKETGKPGDFAELDDAALDRAIIDEARKLGFELTAEDTGEEAETRH